jgi:hypothetical protein
MSIDICLCLEQRAHGRWRVPLELGPRFRDPRTDEGIIEVAWWSHKNPVWNVFFGGRRGFFWRSWSPPLFWWRQGLPADLSEGMRKHGRTHNRIGYEGWIPVKELRLERWPLDTRLLRARVPAREAPRFGDGRGAFPAGVAQPPGASPCLRPRDWTGKARSVLGRLDAETLVEVTWAPEGAVPLAEELDALWYGGLENLAGITPAHDYRLIFVTG